MEKNYQDKGAIPSFEKETLNDIFEYSPLATYFCDVNGLITYYNPAAAEIWGRKPHWGKEYWNGARKIFNRDGSDLNLHNFAESIFNLKAFSSEKN